MQLGTIVLALKNYSCFLILQPWLLIKKIFANILCISYIYTTYIPSLLRIGYVVMYLKTMNYTFKILCWKRFRDDIFVIWNHSLQELHKFFGFMNNIDASGMIELTMSIANNDSVFRFSGFKVTYN